MNKVKTKEILRLRNLPTPPYYVLGQQDLDDLVSAHGSFGFPAVVKPCSMGASVGVSVVRNHHELLQACEGALLFDSSVMVERFLGGMEVHVAILNDRALGAVEVVPDTDHYSYRAKTTSGRCEVHLPARLSELRYRGVLTQALKAHKALGCAGMTMVDMLLSDEGNEHILEVNSLPAFTPTSLAPRVAHWAGLSMGDLVEEILDGAALRSHGEGLAGGDDLRVITLNEPEQASAGASGPN